MVSPLPLPLLSYLLWFDLNPSGLTGDNVERESYLGDISTVTWLSPAAPLPLLPLLLLLTENVQTELALLTES